MVEPGIGQDFEAGADGAPLGIVRAVDEARYTCLDHGASAHAAGLDGDVESCFGKAVVAKKASCLAKDYDFGVSGRVIVADGAVAGAREDFTVADEDRPDRDFPRFGGRTALLKGFLHELDVSFHVERENSMREERRRIETQRLGVRREEGNSSLLDN